jgi:hypothetical protein
MRWKMQSSYKCRTVCSLNQSNVMFRFAHRKEAAEPGGSSGQPQIALPKIFEVKKDYRCLWLTVGWIHKAFLNFMSTIV